MKYPKQQLQVRRVKLINFKDKSASKNVFEALELNSGKAFDLHYKEYHSVVPWRGNTVYLVDSIISMRE